MNRVQSILSAIGDLAHRGGAVKRLSGDLAMGLLTTVVGTLTVAVVDRYDSVSATLLTLAAFAVVVLIINNQDKVMLMLRTRGNWTLPRQVYSVWSFDTDEGEVTVEDTLDIRVQNSYIAGEGVSVKASGDIDISSFRYRLQGEVHPEGRIEGRWWTALPGRNFSGAFQLQIMRGGQFDGTTPIAKGKWIGVSRRSGIRAGDWVWYARG